MNPPVFLFHSKKEEKTQEGEKKGKKRKGEKKKRN